jgi:Glycosyl hydrolase catalytic core
MNRRHLLQLSLAALAPTPLLQAAPKKAANGSTKKGIGLGFRSAGWEKKLAELQCKWTYSWMPKFPEKTPKGISYVPMIFKYDGKRDEVIEAGKTAKKEKVKELLGFNEPDQKDQGAMSVEAALAAWPILEETGLRLGSPAAVHPDNEWMKAFMQQVKKQKLRVDFICIHSYGSPDADKFLKRLKTIHEMYERPIWITEFAIGDWKAKSVKDNQYKPAEVLRFMEEVLPELDSLDFIERYAWFPAKHDNKALGTSTLWDEKGILTPLGECYRDA